MSYEALEMDKPREECGIFGIYSREDNVSLSTYWGLYALQHRGQESAGIAITDGAWMDVHRGMGLVSEVFRHQLPHMEGQRIAIGHVRYSTTGSSLLINTQPLMVTYSGGHIAMAHNGNLTNAQELRCTLEETGSVFQTSIDSEVIVNLIARSRKPTIEEKMMESLTKIEGAYCLVVMTEDKLIGVRDPHGFRPLCIGKTADGWVIASESCALDTVGAELIRDVAPGEMVVVDEAGLHSYGFAENDAQALCIFEYIYFARPDSIIDGQSVYQARWEMGRQLARESGYKADIVISVPDSGTTAALGFSREAGIPFAEGLMKNRYIGRTFIQPEQKKRDLGVRIKLNAVRSVVEGKSIIMVDDSIVRGTTSGKIVHMLKEAGATAVHMCISSPPIAYPCYYGIDTAVRKELIAATKQVEEIRDYIGADSLHYLSLEGLYGSVANIKYDNMCYACFNSKYPASTPCESHCGSNKFVFEQRVRAR
ncbi:amidophosphoribosyltransferase [Propionispora vibrioides]|uniref:Amidophosphoribosyltransferase n=1 Tax=Propionispora vibrioides TaxID=112903 RepID=A0A1H8TBF7_9FIRM|nr:amidophosphoribosyltransferase [Propionispora vibrioides]SEO88076.1 amidophosphoribosyltransferase [Propionispora vibrioides]